MLNISITDFISLLQGVKLITTADGVGTAQCVDVAQSWATVIGSPRFTGDAHDIYNQPGDFYEQIANTPTNQPQGGDIVVLGVSYNGTVGHVGVATGNNTNSTQFEMLEQNDPLGHDIQPKIYNYDHVTGWLRPKQLPQDLQKELDECRIARDKNWDDLIASKTTIDSLNGIITDKNSSISSLTQQISDLNTQLTNSQNTINLLQEQAVKVPDLTRQITQLTSDLAISREDNATCQRGLAQLKSQLQASKPQGFFNKLKFLFM